MKRLAISTIMTDVEEYYDLAPGALLETNRLKTVATARKLAMYLARQHTDHSWTEIADAFHRTHSTVVKTVGGFKKSLAQGNKHMGEVVEMFNNIYDDSYWEE